MYKHDKFLSVSLVCQTALLHIMPSESNYVDKTTSSYDECTTLTGKNDGYNGLFFGEKKEHFKTSGLYIFIISQLHNTSDDIIDFTYATTTVLIKVLYFIRHELSSLYSPLNIMDIPLLARKYLRLSTSKHGRYFCLSAMRFTYCIEIKVRS